ncbi:hypothetical protein B0G71_4370 [Paraburkholderia sp. BL27I4N3]|uniref:hypothetical protein n=1 Tax=Paraburkholderia sp. BL27I4N3 TaxID=1938805 RepID=UPI000E27191B|nr:hypothetical protein [Paraburkholderia sp. BL27I4N3]REE21218.1 hypothetical protein B0G71_4370 [Paraburkholderia sp. BL27I4N3]
MKQFTFDEVQSMTFAQLGAVEDAMDLMATGFISPMLVRYMFRTEQLAARYPGVALPALLNAINKAATMIAFPPEVGQKAPVAVRDEVVDAYLDELQPHTESALKPN